MATLMIACYTDAMQPRVLTRDESLAQECRRTLGRYAAKLAVVDWRLPSAGREVARLRREGCVVVVAADLAPKSVTAAIAAGGDEVVERSASAVKAALERWRRDAGGPVRASAQRHEVLVRKGGAWRRLEGFTPAEVRLLEALLSRPGETVTRFELVESLGEGSVDKHAQSARRKLGPLGRRLLAVRRAGYVWR